MIFSELYKSPRSPLAKLRNSGHNLHSPLAPSVPIDLPTTTPDWVDEQYADLLSKDKTKQKEAVKKYLGDKVKGDWEFPWALHTHHIPFAEAHVSPDKGNGDTEDASNGDSGYQVDEDSDNENDSDSDTASLYSVMSQDNTHYRPRGEWTSDLSDDDFHAPASPFRFENPDNVAHTVHLSGLAKRARRRRQVRKEMEWNQGLACFEARRNAWTGARTVRVRPKPVSAMPSGPRSPRRFFFRTSMSGSPPPPPINGLHRVDSAALSDASSVKDDKELKKNLSNGSTNIDPRMLPVETLIPLPQPILPPTNPLRASITPSVYLSLYDKVILHNLQPSCPINLGDMLRACVMGWKRDGEWPPKVGPIDPGIGTRRKAKNPATASAEKDSRRMSFGLLGRDKDKEKDKDKDEGSPASKGFRKSLQRAFGLNPVPGVDAT